MNDVDPFAWRSGGKRIQIGTQDDNGVSEMLLIDGGMHIITDKNIYRLILADSTDPQRINPATPDSQQLVLTLGSSSEMVGRTLLQAKVLFDDHCLDERIQSEKGISIALSFLKEMSSLDESLVKYLGLENEKVASFEKQLREDGSLFVPSIKNVEQQTKHFIINADHALKHMIEITNLFYPEIGFDKWSLKLHKKLKSDIGETNPVVKFVESISNWVWLMRNLRNAIEHPKSHDQVVISDFALTVENRVVPPSITYQHTETPLENINIAIFLKDTHENLLTCFEQLVAGLCSLNTSPFAGDERVVVQISKEKREERLKHTQFGYQILWTK